MDPGTTTEDLVVQATLPLHGAVHCIGIVGVQPPGVFDVSFERWQQASEKWSVWWNNWFFDFVLQASYRWSGWLDSVPHRVSVLNKVGYTLTAGLQLEALCGPAWHPASRTEFGWAGTRTRYRAASHRCRWRVGRGRHPPGGFQITGWGMKVSTWSAFLQQYTSWCKSLPLKFQLQKDLHFFPSEIFAENIHDVGVTKTFYSTRRLWKMCLSLSASTLSFQLSHKSSINFHMVQTSTINILWMVANFCSSWQMEEIPL